MPRTESFEVSRRRAAERAGRKSKADKSRFIIEKLRRHFEQIDTHRTGCISPAELQVRRRAISFSFSSARILCC